MDILLYYIFFTPIGLSFVFSIVIFIVLFRLRNRFYQVQFITNFVKNKSNFNLSLLAFALNPFAIHFAIFCSMFLHQFLIYFNWPFAQLCAFLVFVFINYKWHTFLLKINIPLIIKTNPKLDEPSIISLYGLANLSYLPLIPYYLLLIGAYFSAEGISISSNSAFGSIIGFIGFPYLIIATPILAITAARFRYRAFHTSHNKDKS